MRQLYQSNYTLNWLTHFNFVIITTIIGVKGRWGSNHRSKRKKKVRVIIAERPFIYIYIYMSISQVVLVLTHALFNYVVKKRFKSIIFQENKSLPHSKYCIGTIKYYIYIWKWKSIVMLCIVYATFKTYQRIKLHRMCL